jgi:hypothetical protein
LIATVTGLAIVISVIPLIRSGDMFVVKAGAAVAGDPPDVTLTINSSTFNTFFKITGDVSLDTQTNYTSLRSGGTISYTLPSNVTNANVTVDLVRSDGSGKYYQAVYSTFEDANSAYLIAPSGYTYDNYNNRPMNLEAATSHRVTYEDDYRYTDANEAIIRSLTVTFDWDTLDASYATQSDTYNLGSNSDATFNIPSDYSVHYGSESPNPVFSCSPAVDATILNAIKSNTVESDSTVTLSNLDVLPADTYTFTFPIRNEISPDHYETISYTLSVVDTRPKVVSTSPTSDAADVPSGAPLNITVTFDEALDYSGTMPAASISPSGQIQLSTYNTTSVTFETTVLLANTRYTVTVSGAKNSSGIEMEPYTFSFTTEDTIPPTVTSADPSDGAINVPVDQVIAVEFSETMDTSQGRMTVNGFENLAGSGRMAWDGTNKVTYSLSAGANLNYYTYYEVKLIGFSDASGNPLPEYTFDFITVPAPDTTAPYVSSTDPGDGATDVPIDTDFVINFSEVMDTTVACYIDIYNDDTQGLMEASSYSYEWNSTSDGIIITLNDGVKLDYGNYYTIQIDSVKDIAGNSMASFTLNFLTAAKPYVAGLYAYGDGAVAGDLKSNFTFTLSDDTVFSDSVTGTLSGFSTGSARLYLNEVSIGSVGAGGDDFNCVISRLSPGRNTITAIHSDGNGNKTKIDRNVYYLTEPYITVAADGSGDYTTISAALAALPNDYTQQIIYVKNGIYNEQVFVNRRNVHIIGQSRDGVKIEYELSNRDAMVNSTHDGVVYVNNAYFILENVTVENTFSFNNGSDQAANALHNNWNGAFFENVTFKSFEQTIYLSSPGTVFDKCTIYGIKDTIAMVNSNAHYFTDTDFIARYTTHRASGDIFAGAGKPFITDCRFLAEDEIAENKIDIFNNTSVSAGNIYMLYCYLSDSVAIRPIANNDFRSTLNVNYWYLYGPGYVTLIETGEAYVTYTGMDSSGAASSFTHPQASIGSGTDRLYIPGVLNNPGTPSVANTTPDNNAPDVDAAALTSDGVEIVFWNIIDGLSDECFTITPEVTISAFTGNRTDRTKIFADWSDGTEYTVNVSDLTGINGAGAMTPYTFTFTTAGNPTVTSTTPSDGATDVARNSNITVNFSKAMDTSKPDPTVSPTVEGDWAWSGTKRIIFTPSDALANETEYTVTLTGYSDASGNPLGTTTLTFTTADDVNPTIASTNPSDGTINVARDSAITVIFSEPMNKSDGSASFSPALNGTWAWNSDGTSVVFTSSDGMANETEYTVTLTGYSDASGNPLGTTIFTFTTADDVNPTIASTAPSDGSINVARDSTVTVVFSEPMSKSDGSASFSPALNGTWAWNSDGTSVVFTPSDGMANETEYTVTLTGYSDASGNPLGTQIITFTTADTVNPTIASTTPSDGAVEVARDSTVTVVFSEPMSKSDGSASFSPALNGTWAWNSDGTSVVFTPSDGMANGTLYTVTLTGYKDDSGNLMTEDSFSFTSYYDSTGDDNADIAYAKTLIETTFMHKYVDQRAMNTLPALRAYAQSLLSGLNLRGVSAVITDESLRAAIAGNPSNWGGVYGEYKLSVRLSKGKGAAVTTGRLIVNIVSTMFRANPPKKDDGTGDNGGGNSDNNDNNDNIDELVMTLYDTETPDGKECSFKISEDGGSVTIIIDGLELVTTDPEIIKKIVDGDIKGISVSGGAFALITTDNEIIAGANKTGSFNSISAVNAINSVIKSKNIIADDSDITVIIGKGITVVSKKTIEKLQKIAQENDVQILLVYDKDTESGELIYRLTLPMGDQTARDIYFEAAFDSDQIDDAAALFERVFGKTNLAAFATRQMGSFGTRARIQVSASALGLDVNEGDTVYIAVYVPGTNRYFRLQGTCGKNGFIAFSTRNGGVLLMDYTAFVK